MSLVNARRDDRVEALLEPVDLTLSPHTVQLDRAGRAEVGAIVLIERRGDTAVLAVGRWMVLVVAPGAERVAVVGHEITRPAIAR